MDEIRFTMVVRGKERIDAFDELIRRDHSTRIAVLNKGLDLLIAHEARLERLCAADEVPHV